MKTCKERAEGGVSKESPGVKRGGRSSEERDVDHSKWRLIKPRIFLDGKKNTRLVYSTSYTKILFDKS